MTEATAITSNGYAERYRLDRLLGGAEGAGGYTWWYFDALSDDGDRALSAIFFIGSVFSPDYALRLDRGEAVRAQEHLGVNIALYHRGRRVAWVMSEYGPEDLRALGEHGPAIAGSAIEPGIGTLRLHLRDRSAPFLTVLAGAGTPVEGEVEFAPLAGPAGASELAATGATRHVWRVPMPRARVSVRFRRPDFSFSGIGYHDVNAGEGRLEKDFARWSWARFHAADRTVVLYAVRPRKGHDAGLVLDQRDGDGPTAPTLVAAPEEGEHRRVGWGMRLPSWFSLRDGQLCCHPGQLLEAAPFYARYLGALSERGRLLGSGIGEYLDLDRFRSPGIRFLLRFRMRRIGARSSLFAAPFGA